jgi:hypothetical protein
LFADPTGGRGQMLDENGARRYDDNGNYIWRGDRVAPGEVSMAAYGSSGGSTVEKMINKINGLSDAKKAILPPPHILLQLLMAEESSGGNWEGMLKGVEDSVSNPQVKLLPESFDFQKTASNWQVAAVTGLKLSVTKPSGEISVVEFEIEVGVPFELKDGTTVSERVAVIASAEAANKAAATIGTMAELSNGKFYDAPALVRKTFSSLMQRNLNKLLEEYLELRSGVRAGARVNSPIQSKVKSKEAVWQAIPLFEKFRIWMNSFF